MSYDGVQAKSLSTSHILTTNKVKYAMLQSVVFFWAWMISLNLCRSFFYIIFQIPKFFVQFLAIRASQNLMANNTQTVIDLEIFSSSAS